MNFDEMNRAFLIAAYTVMWVGVLGYMARLVRKGSRARADYESMRSANPDGDR